MKIMLREISKVLPGKMAEADEVLNMEKALAERAGGPRPAVTRMVPFARQGDRMQTVIDQIELPSLAALEAAVERSRTNPEIREIEAKWEKILESHIIELYIVVE